MRTVVMSLLALALVAAGTTMRAAPDQTARPGDMTEARMWIQNRSRADAVAVNLRAADIETPLRVQVANTDSNPHSVSHWFDQDAAAPAGMGLRHRRHRPRHESDAGAQAARPGGLGNDRRQLDECAGRDDAAAQAPALTTTWFVRLTPATRS